MCMSTKHQASYIDFLVSQPLNKLVYEKRPTIWLLL